MIRFIRSAKFKKGLSVSLTLFVIFAALSCSKNGPPSDEILEREKLCKTTDSAKTYEETPFRGGKATVLSYQNIRSGLISACASCHMVPAQSGGFTFQDSWKGSVLSVGGKSAFYPGLFDVADQIRGAIQHQDPSKRMPPAEKRDKNPDVFLELGRQVSSWIMAGKPNGTFREGVVETVRRGKLRPTRPRETSELGDCTPTAKAIGFDYKTDRNFESMTALPKYLSETDLVSLDALVLAGRGTFSYNVEYPLWADNAEKGRYVHVPKILKDGTLQNQSIEYNAQTKQFNIPENTRFYKTFYRAVKLPNKKILMRRMETRLIVSRKPWQKSLFGTYQWDDTEQIATLVETPYRDGTAWKDLISDVVVDVAKEKVRPYAIPGRQRCIDCHMGSASQDFVLGFQPLQINKRAFGEGGRDQPTLTDDLNQVARFKAYGLISGVDSAADLPVLEKQGITPPHNVHELRANGYTVGNCYHCHNPNGLAFTKENGIQLALGPGDIFGFNTQARSVEMPQRRIVHQNGELDGSHIWRKISDTQAQLGMFSRMPMHTPGSPDCRALRTIGKWIRSFESIDAANRWEPECKKENPFFWIDMDFTWPMGDVYVPRRSDWNDLANGMSQKYRDIQMSSTLENAIKTEYAVGYWAKKPECTFPTVNLPESERRPWMMKGSDPKRPFGEVYRTTPGSYFFRNTCMKCHGPAADGNSSLARGILNWSGGSVRVANLSGGMFGNKAENLKTFDTGGTNLARNYLIWMAMEGTRVKFPPEISSYMGKHGGQMLNGIRDKCLAQISSDKPSSPVFMDHEVFNKVCFMDNLAPGDPALEFDPVTNEPKYPDKVEEWLDRGAWNAGAAIFEFLKESNTTGVWRPNNDQCEVVYGPPGAAPGG